MGKTEVVVEREEALRSKKISTIRQNIIEFPIH
jgi:hypothetical protein